MKNIDLRRLHAGLSSVGHLTGLTFALAVAKNLRLVETAIGDVERACQPSEAFNAYKAQQDAVIVEHAEVGPDGMPLKNVIGDRWEYVIPDKNALQSAADRLDAQFAKVIAEHNARLEIWGADAEPLDLAKVARADIPEALTAQQASSIVDMLDV